MAERAANKEQFGLAMTAEEIRASVANGTLRSPRTMLSNQEASSNVSFTSALLAIDAEVLSSAEAFVQAWIEHPRVDDRVGQAHAQLIRDVLARRPVWPKPVRA